MKTMRVMCLQCEQVVDFDIGSAWCLFHFDHKLGPCTGVYEWRALTRFENFCDITKRALNWRMFIIMTISGAPIMIFNQWAFGFNKLQYPMMAWVGWLLVMFIAARLLRKKR